jgi:hypothetical protein
MKYYTTDPSKRAMSVSLNEIKKDKNQDNFVSKVLKLYDQILKEFVEQEKEIICGRNLTGN